jgi:hypothetical protein
VGLAPVMALAEQAGLSELLAEKVRLGSNRVASAGVNPAGKVTAIIAGMAAGADSIDDLQVIRSGGMKRVFTGVYAPATLGQFLREFTHGHTLQLASVLRAHLVNLTRRTDLLAGIDDQAYVDIDSLLRPVYGHAKQGASFGHTKISGKQVLRKGLSPLATAISTPTAAPVVSGIRLRAGKAGSGRGADSMVTEAIKTARAAGATGKILVRGDSAYGIGAVVGACLKADAEFSLVLAKNPAVTRAIATIAEDAWTPVHYPGAVLDPDTGELISDAEVAETTYTAFASTDHPVTARLIVRRVRDRAKTEELFPVWRYHPFFTNSDEPTTAADITHRRHAIIETVFADLIDGPLAHLPSVILSSRGPRGADLHVCVVDGVRDAVIGGARSMLAEEFRGVFFGRVATTSTRGEAFDPRLAECLSEGLSKLTVVLLESPDPFGRHFEPAKQGCVGGLLPARCRGLGGGCSPVA